MKKVIKNTGTPVDFNENTLRKSIIKAGASDHLAESIISEVKNKIKDGETTRAIFKNVFDILSKREVKIAMEYSLKNAIFNFGPTGFPFEKFVADIFKRKGYDVTTNVHLKGKCISHEVDVFTTKPKRIAMEVKFHNDMRIRSDVKTVLYAKARFDDLMGDKSLFTTRNVVADSCILVTNTKFTRTAIEYAECAGVQLLGWGYPFHNNLQHYIKEVDAHPITCIPSLKSSDTKKLFDMGITTCRDLIEKENILKSLQNSNLIKQEAEILCQAISRN